jgi:hypothetical protein
VFVAVYEVARLDDQAADGDRRPDLDDVDLGVGDEDGRREELEARSPHLPQVAHSAVRHRADHPKRCVCTGVHLAPVGAEGIRRVEVFDYGDPGLRRLRELGQTAP